MYNTILKFCFIVLCIIIIGIFIIKRFVYFQPSYVMIPYNEAYTDVSEGNLHGWFVGPKNNITILICHGNAGNISHRQSIINSFTGLGYSVMIFDYSGYGRSRGVPSESQFYQDASMFINILLQYTNKNNIVLYGESIGAPVAAHIAVKYNIDTLILDSGIPSIQKYIQSKFGIVGTLFGFIFPEFNTEEYLHVYKGNTLILHSITDEIIPYNITDVMRQYAKQTINIYGTHNNRLIPWEQVDMFIKQIKNVQIQSSINI